MQKQLNLLGRKVGVRGGRAINEVCDDLSIKAQSRTLNGIVGFVKVSALRGLSILISIFCRGGLCAGVHRNPLLCCRDEEKQRQGRKEKKCIKMGKQLWLPILKEIYCIKRFLNTPTQILEVLMTRL